MPETMREQVLLLTDPDKIPVSFVVDRLQKKQASYQDNLDDLKSIPIANFIGQYVELRPVASGYIGLCPFHDDETPSFGINVNGNYWHCFADCGGGDLVSFYMKFHNVSFYVAVKELRQWMRS
jgi:DNA primase